MALGGSTGSARIRVDNVKRLVRRDFPRVVLHKLPE